MASTQVRCGAGGQALQGITSRPPYPGSDLCSFRLRTSGLWHSWSFLGSCQQAIALVIFAPEGWMVQSKTAPESRGQNSAPTEMAGLPLT